MSELSSLKFQRESEALLDRFVNILPRKKLLLVWSGEILGKCDICDLGAFLFYSMAFL